MDTGEFDELFESATTVLRAIRNVYGEVVGEEFDLESALKNYPLLLLGVAAGAGFLGGWWAARRRGPKALPGPAAAGTAPLDVLERLFPAQVGKLRAVLPEGAADEAANAAKQWVDSVIEPRLKERLDAASGSRFGLFVRDTFQRFDRGEDRTLDDPRA